jgi:hypothetical protein
MQDGLNDRIRSLERNLFVDAVNFCQVLSGKVFLALVMLSVSEASVTYLLNSRTGRKEPACSC